jgi:hypothetical protein
VMSFVAVRIAATQFAEQQRNGQLGHRQHLR